MKWSAKWDRFVTVTPDGTCHSFGANIAALLDGEFLWMEDGKMKASNELKAQIKMER
jgi:hypothetical protein